MTDSTVEDPKTPREVAEKYAEENAEFLFGISVDELLSNAWGVLQAVEWVNAKWPNHEDIPQDIQDFLDEGVYWTKLALDAGGINK